MNLSDIISSDCVFANIKAQNKKHLLQEISGSLAKEAGLDARAVFETLLQREKLGSTGLGQGIAIPHGRIAGVKSVHGLFARLAHPIAFDSVDGQPVDIVFALVAPEHAGADHLTALARISRLMRDQSVVKKLRGTETPEGLYAILTEPVVSAAASAA